MSGLLRRLAEQALGSGDAAIHPLASIPYVAPLELATEVATVPDPDRTAERRDGVRDGPNVPPHPDPQATLVEQPRSQLPVPDERARSPAAAEPPIEPRVTPKRRSDERAPASARTVAEGDVSEAAESRWTAPLTLAPPMGEPQGPEPRAPMRLTLPAALVPPARPGRSHPASSVPHRAAGPLEARRAHEAETHEVHVHIGRIEVTAVQEAPPRKTRAAPTRTPMSLDEYLARRKERRT